MTQSAEITERKALIMARFTLFDAQSLCGFAGHVVTGQSDICPSCRVPGLNFVISAKGSAARRLTDDVNAANYALCSACDWRGDAAQFVIAARKISVPAALDMIETYLLDHWRPNADRRIQDAKTSAYHSPLSRPLRAAAHHPRRHTRALCKHKGN